MSEHRTPAPTASDRLLGGWGRGGSSRAMVRTIDPTTSLSSVLDDHRSLVERRGVLARGLGRSYNDAAQDSGGLVVVLDDEGRGRGPAKPHGGIAIDPSTGIADVGAGVSLETLMRAALPLGWFVPVTPGTRHVTVGGAVAADVHGKNHHVDGAIGSHVVNITLDAPVGRLELRPDGDELCAARFWTTVGGMGLTGVIRSVRLQLRRVETASMLVDTQRADDLSTLLSILTDDRSTYSVAWVDVLARGRHLGRAVVSTGEHATRDDLPPRHRDHPLRPDFGRAVSVPALPLGIVGRATTRLFNEAWFRKAPRHRVGELQGVGAFFHPLDGLSEWNRLYGPSGMLQWQCAVPFGAEQVLEGALWELSRHGLASPVVVLKRFGPSDPGPLSFPMPGWTLAVDLPTRSCPADLLHRLDAEVVAAGGRLYLAKDFRMRASLLPSMYPRLATWRATRDGLDPHRSMASDLARRLDLLGPSEQAGPVRR